METGSIKATYDMYINECVLENDYIDYEELKKAADQIHQYFNREITIKISNGYSLTFEPVDEKSASLVGKILSTDASNLQEFIKMLRFRRLKVAPVCKSKRNTKIANGIDLFLRCVQDKNDRDNFSTFDANYIYNVLDDLGKYINYLHEKGDFSDIKVKKLSDKDMLIVYQILQEIFFILELLYA